MRKRFEAIVSEFGGRKRSMRTPTATLPDTVSPQLRSARPCAPQSCPADYVVALPHDAMLVLYTDGITEHERDPVKGEVELIAAARYVFDHPELEAAAAIADRVLRLARGSDDAATMALRLH